MIWRLMGTIVTVVLVFALLSWGWRRLTAPEHRPPAAPPPVATVSVDCRGPQAMAAAAAANGSSVQHAAWSVFGRTETGWEIYAPLTAHEVGVTCPPQSPGFAAALARWQAARKLPSTGIMDEPTMDALRLVWLRRRPIVGQTADGACPAPPPESQLASAAPQEGYAGKPVQLRADALDAYRRLRAAARAQGLLADRQTLTLVSGFRGPAEEAAGCPGGGCNRITRANCSAHRTGLAMDLYLGAAPGSGPASSEDANRLYLSRTAIYRWLVANGARFGFVNYPFEPWHWEWTGQPSG